MDTPKKKNASLPLLEPCTPPKQQMTKNKVRGNALAIIRFLTSTLASLLTKFSLANYLSSLNTPALVRSATIETASIRARCNNVRPMKRRYLTLIG